MTMRDGNHTEMRNIFAKYILQVLEVTMRDGNSVGICDNSTVVLNVLEVTMRDGNLKKSM